MSFMMKSPREIALDIAKKSKEVRLSLNLSQKTLSERSGVSYGSLKRFERTGCISLESLLKLALVLNSLNDFESLFTQVEDNLPPSLDTLLDKRKRQRGKQ